VRLEDIVYATVECMLMSSAHVFMSVTSSVSMTSFVSMTSSVSYFNPASCHFFNVRFLSHQVLLGLLLILFRLVLLPSTFDRTRRLFVVRLSWYVVSPLLSFIVVLLQMTFVHLRSCSLSSMYLSSHFVNMSSIFPLCIFQVILLI